MRSLTLTVLLAAHLAVAIPIAHADINVGVILSLTGPNASLGLPYQKGLDFLPKEIAGEKVNVIALDDATDPSAAVRSAQKLIAESNVDVLIGTSNTPGTYAIAEIAYHHKVPQIAIAPANITGDKANWFVSIPQPAEIWILPIINDMKKKGIKDVAFIGFSDPWGDLGFNALKEVGGKAGLNVVADERYARADTNVSGQILKLLARKPQAVFVGASGTAGALPHIALAERGFGGPQYATIAIFNQEFIRIGGKALEGMYAVSGPISLVDQLPAGHPTRAVGTDFVQKLTARHGAGAVNGFSAYSYDASLLFADAAKRTVGKAKPGTPEFRVALRDAIFDTKELVGTHGVYTFKQGSVYGVDERAAVLGQVVGGSWKLVP